MFISPTLKNTSLASAVNNRIKADGSMIAAKAALWRLVGLGAFCLLTGLGVGAVFLGYAQVTDSRTSAERMATAFASALEHANLGTVRLSPESTVNIKPDASIKLDATAAMVRIDPSSTVRIAGDFPRPTEDQLSGGGSDSNAKTVTDFAVFKEVAFGKGTVSTGWSFSSSEQSRPDAQFCYYTEHDDGTTSMRLELARDGQLLPQPPSSPFKTLNFSAAAARCIWFH